MICNKNSQRKFDEKLKERFFNTYKFYNDNNKFILLLRKGVYPYEHLDNWEKFSETSLPEKEGFYSHSNMKDITDADYAHAKEFVNILKQKIYVLRMFQCSKQYTVSRCISGLSKYVLKYMSLILQNFFQLQD